MTRAALMFGPPLMALGTVFLSACASELPVADTQSVADTTH